MAGWIMKNDEIFTSVLSRVARRPAAVLSASLLAATPGARADPPELDPVEVGAFYDNSVGSSDAASQGSIRRELLDSRPALRTGEILEYVPGVIVTQHSGDGKANQYFLRGFNLDHGTDFATTVDGMPVNLPTHGHGHGYTDLNFLLPELVDRIDYRKGPYFAGDGDFSSAGAADIRLRSRLDGNIGQVTLGGDGYRRLLGAGSVAIGEQKNLLGALELGRQDGPWTLPEDLRRVNGVLRLSGQDGTDRYSIAVMGYSSRWNSTDQIPQRAIDDGRLGRFDAIDTSNGGRTERYSLSGQWSRALEGSGRIEASAYAIRYSLDLFSNFTYFLADPIAGDQFEQRDRRSVFGGTVKRVWFTHWGDRHVTTEVGVQTRHDRIQVGLFDTVARQRRATVRDDRVRQTSVGVHAQNGIQWTPWLRSVLGVRFDRFGFDVDSRLDANDGTASATRASPKFTLVATAAPKTELFFNAGRGFHSNDARGTVTRVDPRTGDPVSPVPGLVPSTGVEVGVRTEAIPHLQSSLALWQLRIGSELVFVGDAGTTEASRPSRRQGIEWNNRYTPLPWLLFDADLALTRARFSDDDPAGDRIPGSASRVASLAASVRGLGPWSASLQLRYLGARPLIEDNSAQSRPSTLVNLRLGYRFSKGLDAWLDVFNLFDREVNDIEYFYESRLAGETVAVADRHLHPVEPRTVRLTLRATY